MFVSVHVMLVHISLYPTFSFLFPFLSQLPFMPRKVNSSNEATSLFYIHATVAGQVEISVICGHEFKINYKYIV